MAMIDETTIDRPLKHEERTIDDQIRLIAATVVTLGKDIHAQSLDAQWNGTSHFFQEYSSALVIDGGGFCFSARDGKKHDKRLVERRSVRVYLKASIQPLDCRFQST